MYSAPGQQLTPMMSLQHLNQPTRKVMLVDRNGILRTHIVSDLQFNCVESIVCGQPVAPVTALQQQAMQYAAAQIPQQQIASAGPSQQSLTSQTSQASSVQQG